MLISSLQDENACEEDSPVWDDEDDIWKIFYNPEKATDGNRKNCIGQEYDVDGYDDRFYLVDDQT